jgi:ectoine hydroxylase-related dioxygenase (phytanoyl-CoA dioxygenase family)
MLRRTRGYLLPYPAEQAPEASRQLEQEGYAHLKGVFSDTEIGDLKQEIEQVYLDHPRDGRADAFRSPAEDEDFRYEMFNRSRLAQLAIAHPDILATIEPLLGADCHIIANTCWRNPVRERNDHGGGFWHIDAGPHVPRDPDIPWDDRIPYPIFAIGAHIYLQACPIESGPTGVIPGSHKSGSPPPKDRHDDIELTYNGVGVKPLIAQAGDVCLFVSDVWHRRLPAGSGNQGRFFLQAHYGRRDLAQRVLPTDQVNHTSPSARARADSERAQTLIGLHPSRFYDG